MHKLVYPIKKKIYKYKSLFYDNRGFTLLEMVVVIAIMGLLATMVVPVVGHMSISKRVRLTEEKLKEIKTAIIGRDNVYDEKGFPVVRGYVGNMGHLPKLYKSTWDTEKNEWKWENAEGNYEEINDGSGQPRGLWMKKTGNDDLGDDWKGPYISYPRDIYPDDTKHLDPTADKELFEKRQIDGKLFDAWGYSLFFWKEYDTPADETTVTLWIISEGPDKKSLMPNPGESYDEAADVNRDNIVIKITPNEWYRANNIGREDETIEILEELRNAFIGRSDVVDSMGRKIVGGYIGDMGQWPKLYKWDASNSIWEELNDYATEYGQPRNLWIKEVDDNWKGSYIPEPWGDGENQVIKDAWCTEMRFKIGDDGVNEFLKIISAGIDRAFDTDDDLYITIFDYEWRGSDTIPLMENKRIEDTKKIFEEIRKALLGADDAFDSSGRRIVGGYIGDMGQWPALYKWNGSSWVELADYINDGQPRNLWIEESGAGNGFEWNGPYISKPWGVGEDEVLKDAWGNFIKFELDDVPNNATVLTITSGGADSDYDTVTDNVYMEKSVNEWNANNTRISGWIYNETEFDGAVTIKLYNKPGSNIEDTINVTSGSAVYFTLPECDVYCGKRKLKITGDINKELNIFIGTGGTQSPTEDNLKFYIK